MSVAELAESVCIGRAQMVAIEEGKHQPSEIELGLIAYALETSTGY
jgi:hypothetical protein